MELISPLKFRFLVFAGLLEEPNSVRWFCLWLVLKLRWNIKAGFWISGKMSEKSNEWIFLEGVRQVDLCANNPGPAVAWEAATCCLSSLPSMPWIRTSKFPRAPPCRGGRREGLFQGSTCRFQNRMCVCTYKYCFFFFFFPLPACEIYFLKAHLLGCQGWPKRCYRENLWQQNNNKST